jgi:hypothetical protein
MKNSPTRLHVLALTSHVSTRVSLQLAAPATSRRHMTQPELAHAPRSRPNTSTRMLYGKKQQTVHK